MSSTALVGPARPLAPERVEHRNEKGDLIFGPQNNICFTP
jgi:hypothetical protein